jgi:hypothetical protein
MIFHLFVSLSSIVQTQQFSRYEGANNTFHYILMDDSSPCPGNGRVCTFHGIVSDPYICIQCPLTYIIYVGI